MNQWRRWPEQSTLADPAWNWLARAFAMPALLATPPRALIDYALPQSRLDAAPFATLLGPARVRRDAEARLRHAGDVLQARNGDLTDAPDVVLLPRQEEDVLAILKLCAQNGWRACLFGAGDAGSASAPVCIDMTGMSRLKSVDAASGVAEVEAGITGEELARQLAARKLMLPEEIDGTLGGRLALAPAEWLADLRLATPRGVIPSGFTQAAGSRGRLGAITAATLKVRPLPAHLHHAAFVFPDFAAGLEALTQARARDIVHFNARLSDAAESDFHRHLRVMKIHPLLRWREWPSGGSSLTLSFPDWTARLRFGFLAHRLGGRPQRAHVTEDYRAMLLDRGVMVLRWRIGARWSQLPALKTALSDALEQAMREQAPRPGAQGLVLSHLRNTRSEGADLVVSALYPRLLNDDVAQAQAIRGTGDAALRAQLEAPQRPGSDVTAVIKLVLDPRNVLPA